MTIYLDEDEEKTESPANSDYDPIESDSEEDKVLRKVPSQEKPIWTIEEFAKMWQGNK